MKKEVKHIEKVSWQEMRDSGLFSSSVGLYALIIKNKNIKDFENDCKL